VAGDKRVGGGNWKEGMGVFWFGDKRSRYEGLWRDDVAVSGAYTRGPMQESWMCTRHTADDGVLFRMRGLRVCVT
jgi:hypothetical protein